MPCMGGAHAAGTAICVCLNKGQDRTLQPIGQMPPPHVLDKRGRMTPDRLAIGRETHGVSPVACGGDCLSDVRRRAGPRRNADARRSDSRQ